MQASRSLFQTGIRLQGAPANTGISKTRPFLNIWSDKDQSPQNPSSLPSPQQKRTMASATTFFDFTPKDSTFAPPRSNPHTDSYPHHPTEKGQPYPLSQHRNKVLLVVNTASKCGFTPQFSSLETLHKTLAAKYPDDFALLAFPCNQFNSQDPGSDAEIQSFCQLNYGVSFPVLAKTDVNGAQAEAVWEWMKKEQPGLMGMKRVKWNFEKFLIGRDGKVVGRWASTTKPESLEKVIVEEIEKGKSKM